MLRELIGIQRIPTDRELNRAFSGYNEKLAVLENSPDSEQKVVALGKEIALTVFDFECRAGICRFDFIRSDPNDLIPRNSRQRSWQLDSTCDVRPETQELIADVKNRFYALFETKRGTRALPSADELHRQCQQLYDTIVAFQREKYLPWESLYEQNPTNPDKECIDQAIDLWKKSIEIGKAIRAQFYQLYSLARQNSENPITSEPVDDHFLESLPEVGVNSRIFSILRSDAAELLRDATEIFNRHHESLNRFVAPIARQGNRNYHRLVSSFSFWKEQEWTEETVAAKYSLALERTQRLQDRLQKIKDRLNEISPEEKRGLGALMDIVLGTITSRATSNVFKERQELPADSLLDDVKRLFAEFKGIEQAVSFDSYALGIKAGICTHQVPIARSMSLGSHPDKLNRAKQTCAILGWEETTASLMNACEAACEAFRAEINRAFVVKRHGNTFKLRH